MKKQLPVFIPVAAVIIVLILMYRWYSMRTDNATEPVIFGEGVEIENLSADELGNLRGSDDVTTVPLNMPAAESTEEPAESVTGAIRYEIAAENVNLGVSAQLPDLEAGMYQVWFKSVENNAARKAFMLEVGKGGYMGSASVPVSLLPFQVVVTQEMNADDNTMENVLLQGTIEKPATESATQE